jgi:antitoxin component YwqK of YwqJK toxin-antitoxin module
MKKKFLIYTLIAIIVIIIFTLYVISVNKKAEQQRTQYPYSEIQINNNKYYYKNELLTGMSYILENNTDSISLTITDGILTHREIYTDNKQTQKSEYYNENGKLSFTNNTKNGEIDGIQEHYHENGKLFWKETYKNGLKDGIEEQYNDKGILTSRAMYVNGKKEGLSETFRDNGTIWVKTMYVNDKKEGSEEFYNENGKFSFSNEYRNDVQIKEDTENSSDGQSSGGVYTYETGYRRMKITITPEKWFGWLEDGSGDGNYTGKTIIGGKINGSDLYDENGIEKRGYVSGSTIYYNDPLGEIKLSKR